MSTGELSRRAMLRAGGVVAAGAAMGVVPGVSFAAPASGSGQQTKTVTGAFRPDVPDWYYLPVDVPRGVKQIDVVYSYDKPAVPAGTRGNACDIGMFGPEGHELGTRRGFRGWSGGFRDRFSLSASSATPGYLAGPITSGRWHVILGPYTVAPQGMNYRVDITLTFGRDDAPPFRPNPAPASAPARDRGRSWYRGDCHLHTIHSDGRRTPQQLVADARAAGLDFIVSTDHNTSSSQLVWGDHATGDLLILNGEEVTTPVRPLARDRPAAGHLDRLALPRGRPGRFPAVHRPGPPGRRPGHGRAPVRELLRLHVRVRLRDRRPGRGLERPVDHRRRSKRHPLGRPPPRRPLDPRHRRFRRTQPGPDRGPPAHGRPSGPAGPR